MYKAIKYSVALSGLVACAVSQQLHSAEPSPRIIGGSVVPDNRYAFMAAIYFDLDGDRTFTPGCGGSIISDRWVLTAAHCVVDSSTGQQLSSNSVAALVGALNIFDQSQGTLIEVDRIVVHPGYELETFVSDIALLELSQPVNIPVMTLPATGSTIPQVNESSIVAGWGVTSLGGDQSGPLLEVSLPIVSHSDCLSFYPNSLQADANVCAGGLAQGGRDSCQGDSGGPLFVTRNSAFIQAGIVSYGEGCALPGIPGVYTRMTSYTDWVQSFVPDIQTDNSGQGEGVVVAPEPDNDSQFTQLTAAAPTQSGSLEEDEVAVFEVTGATRVDLTTISGDADLFISEGASFATSDIICTSIEPTALDSCEVPASADRHFASVKGYLDSTYSISVSGSPVTVVEQPEPVVEPEPIADNDDGEIITFEPIAGDDNTGQEDMVTSLLDGGSSSGGSISAQGMMLFAVLILLRRFRNIRSTIVTVLD